MRLSSRQGDYPKAVWARESSRREALAEFAESPFLTSIVLVVEQRIDIIFDLVLTIVPITIPEVRLTIVKSDPEDDIPLRSATISTQLALSVD
jgi:hypothetical protein